VRKEEKESELDKISRDMAHVFIESNGYVKLSEIDLRELIDEEKLKDFLKTVNNWENKPANGYLHDSFCKELAKAIKEQANELVKEGK